MGEITDEMAERAWAVLSVEIQPPYPVDTRTLTEHWDVMTAAQQRKALVKINEEHGAAYAKSIALMRRVLEAAQNDAGAHRVGCPDHPEGVRGS